MHARGRACFQQCGQVTCLHKITIDFFFRLSVIATVYNEEKRKAHDELLHGTILLYECMYSMHVLHMIQYIYT